jgi:predicted transcriptional regulator
MKEEKEEFGLLKKFACSTCLAVMESINDQPQVLPEITKITKINKKEVAECLRFAEENMLLTKHPKGYVLNEKGKEALRRFKEVSPLICEP